MSLEYSLSIRSNRTPAEIVQSLAQFGASASAHAQMTGPGLDGIWALAESEVGKSTIQEAVGFTPDVILIFQINKHEWKAGVHTMLGYITGLLRQTKNDAILLFNGESPVLLQKDGRLTLSNEFGFWTAANLSAVTLPYTIEPVKLFA